MVRSQDRRIHALGESDHGRLVSSWSGLRFRARRSRKPRKSRWSNSGCPRPTQRSLFLQSRRSVFSGGPGGKRGSVPACSRSAHGRSASDANAAPEADTGRARASEMGIDASRRHRMRRVSAPSHPRPRRAVSRTGPGERHARGAQEDRGVRGDSGQPRRAVRRSGPERWKFDGTRRPRWPKASP